MARVKIELPETFNFSTNIPIRITDLNYGNHVGNDSILSIIHEARVQFLQHHALHELSFAGVSLIMSDVSIQFKSELFYGDIVKAYVAVANVSKAAFDFYYKLVRMNDETLVAIAKTGMVCFDYKSRKVATVPQEAVNKFTH